MAYADHVQKTVWTARYNWLRETEEREEGIWHSILLSPQGLLLTYDIEISFCAGAWVAVIILAHAAIDATLRDTEFGDYNSNSKKIFGNDKNLQWLRELRNRLVHVSSNHPSMFSEEDLNNVATFQEGLEADARRAVTLLYRTIYANPGT